jgi:chorismate mutase/prephenate dehydrogenase
MREYPAAALSPLSGRRLVIVGGKGQMGRLFSRHFQSSGLAVLCLDLDNQEEAAGILSQAAAVIICVPIAVTLEVISSLPSLPPGCILADLTSIKQQPLQAMLQRHPGPVMGLHPMFGPDINEMRDQRLVYCPGRQEDVCRNLLAVFAYWGIKLVEIAAAELDRNMAFIQGQRHFINLCLGANLMNNQVNMARLLDMGTPAFYLEMMQVGRFFSQQAELYADIIMASENNLACIRNFCQLMEQMAAMLENNDRAGFIELFRQVSQWLGSYGSRLNQHSKEALLTRFY